MKRHLSKVAALLAALTLSFFAAQPAWATDAPDPCPAEFDEPDVIVPGLGTL